MPCERLVGASCAPREQLVVVRGHSCISQEDLSRILAFSPATTAYAGIFTHVGETVSLQEKLVKHFFSRTAACQVLSVDLEALLGKGKAGWFRLETLLFQKETDSSTVRRVDQTARPRLVADGNLSDDRCCDVNFSVARSGLRPLTSTS